MLEWKERPGSIYRPHKSYQITYKEHIIRVMETERVGDYVFQWNRGSHLEVQHPFNAETLDEAKAYAIAALKNYFSEKAAYWRDTKIGFTNFLEDNM